jgi:hypothetical protein
MYNWLHQNLPGTKKGSYTPDRWKKLTGAFGEGWEADFKKGRLGGISRAQAARWDARLVEVKAWVVRHRRYPVYGKTPAETSMYRWLRNNLPGKPCHTPARWKKLNDAFGEGWEADFGKEAKWDKRFAEVKAWVVRHRRYPGKKTPAEKSLYDWLHQNLPGKKCYTPARWKKLNDAFGEGWEARRLTCLPC